MVSISRVDDNNGQLSTRKTYFVITEIKLFFSIRFHIVSFGSLLQNLFNYKLMRFPVKGQHIVGRIHNMSITLSDDV